MGKLLVVYTLKGCQWCDDFKGLLKENSIPFKNRDIEKYEEEYNLFVEMKNDFVPSFMIVNQETETAELYAPDMDYQDLNEALDIVKQNL